MINNVQTDSHSHFNISKSLQLPENALKLFLQKVLTCLNRAGV